MEQKDLFACTVKTESWTKKCVTVDSPAEYIDLGGKPASHSQDPISSFEAEEEITKSGIRGSQMREILELVKKHPRSTSRELSTLCRLDRYQIARRLSDLEFAGKVEKGRTRLCTIGQRKAVEWIEFVGRIRPYKTTLKPTGEF